MRDFAFQRFLSLGVGEPPEDAEIVIVRHGDTSGRVWLPLVCRLCRQETDEAHQTVKAWQRLSYKHLQVTSAKVTSNFPSQKKYLYLHWLAGETVYGKVSRVPHITDKHDTNSEAEERQSSPDTHTFRCLSFGRNVTCCHKHHRGRNSTTVFFCCVRCGHVLFVWHRGLVWLAALAERLGVPSRHELAVTSATVAWRLLMHTDCSVYHAACS